MTKATEWDFLDACSHTEWRNVLEIVARVEQALNLEFCSITIAETFFTIERLDKQGLVETQRFVDEAHRPRLQARKTPRGIRAGWEAHQKQTEGSFEPGLKPV